MVRQVLFACEITLFVTLALGSCSQQAHLEIVTDQLLPARHWAKYEADLQARGGIQPLVWSGKDLPKGLFLSPDGCIEGIIAAPSGNYIVEVNVRDSAGASAVRKLSLAIVPIAGEKKEVTSPRASCCAVELDGKVYLIGGMAENAGWTSFLERYEPQGDTWTSLSPMNYPRNSAAACAFGGKIYVFGGFAGASSDAVEEYDPKTDKWSERKRMLYPRFGAGIGVIGGKIYLIGGWKSCEEKHPAGCGGHPSAEVEEYDPEKDQWEEKSSLPIPRGYLACVSADGKIFAFCGMGKEGPVSTVTAYDPKTDTWRLVNSPPEGTAYHCAAEVNGKIYLLCGLRVQGPTDAVIEYDPQKDSYALKPPVGVARIMSCSAVIDKKIYLFGGRVGSFLLGLTEEYTP